MTEPRFHFHWQNLNEDKNGRVKGWPFHGRCWLHVRRDSGSSLTFRFSWNLWSRFCRASVDADPMESGLNASLALPPVALWFGVEGLRWKWLNNLRDAEGYLREGREVSLAVHSGSLWWRLWACTNGWSSKTPWWQHGSFDFPDFFLGRRKYSEEVLSEHDVIIPMPEGGYPARVKLERRTWKRSRWFAETRLGATVDLAKGIPHQGKGENSWDCGEDALMGMSCPSASTVEEAIAAVVRSALGSRRRYDGNVMAAYPAPEARVERQR